jgi:hypothetical protein
MTSGYPPLIQRARAQVALGDGTPREAFQLGDWACGMRAGRYRFYAQLAASYNTLVRSLIHEGLHKPRTINHRMSI